MVKKQENFFYNILTSNFGTIGYISVRKLVLLNSYLIIGIFAFSLLGFYNIFITQNYPIATIDIVSSIIFAGSIISLRTYHNQQTIIKFISAVLMIFMTVFVALNGNKSFGLIWSFFAPMFLITTNGHKKGALLSILFYIGMIITLLAIHDTWEAKDINALVFTRYIVAHAVCTFVIFMGEYAISKLQNELEELSSTDNLTKLHNRGKMEEYIEILFEQKKLKNGSLVIVMADIDDFKSINDTYGHHVGDDVLRDISKILDNNTRSVDVVGRWGGEEFLMIFPRTSFENVMIMIERLKKEMSIFEFQEGIKVTCSFGVCDVISNNFSNQDAIICADNALYKAKNEGKDKICTTSL